MVAGEVGWYRCIIVGIWGHEEGSGRSAPNRLFFTHPLREENNVGVLENHCIIEMLRYLPSNAAATLLLRFCVASNALAVAAAEGGLLVLIVVPDLLQEQK